MHQLITIGQTTINDRQVRTVIARDLHEYLGVAKDFSDWFRSQVDGMFTQDIDFAVFPQKGENTGGRPRIEYAVTIECAKHIAMMSRTPNGKLIREYFIECERQAITAPSFNIPTSLSGALRLAAEQADTIEAQARQLIAAKPSVDFVEKYVDSSGTKGFRQVCKLLGANESEFREFLKDKKIMYRLGGEWMPHAQHLDTGRFNVKAGQSDLNGHSYNSARFTTKGVSWVAGEFAKHQLELVESGVPA